MPLKRSRWKGHFVYMAYIIYISINIYNNSPKHTYAKKNLLIIHLTKNVELAAHTNQSLCYLRINTHYNGYYNRQAILQIELL